MPAARHFVDDVVDDAAREQIALRRRRRPRIQTGPSMKPNPAATVFSFASGAMRVSSAGSELRDAERARRGLRVCAGQSEGNGRSALEEQRWREGTQLAVAWHLVTSRLAFRRSFADYAPWRRLDRCMPRRCPNSHRSRRQRRTLPEMPPAALDGKTPPQRRWVLRMVRWLRPEYLMEWASMGIEGSVLLDLRIVRRGQPVEIVMAQSSGSSQLDTSVLRAARLWKFAPPVYKTRPVEVESRSRCASTATSPLACTGSPAHSPASLPLPDATVSPTLPFGVSRMPPRPGRFRK